MRKRSRAKSRLASGAIVLAVFLMITAYQNCGRGFSAEIAESNAASSASTATNPPSPLPVPISAPAPAPAPAAGCAATQTSLGGVCYDSDPAHFRVIQNNAAALPGKIQVVGIGANAFDPAKLSNWNYDERGAILAPQTGKNRNIYAPQAVLQGGTFWNVYYGGWDGTATKNDQVYLTTTADNFGTFGGRATVISHGLFTHVNNDSVIKVGPSDWRMAYTAYAINGLNKPCYATSTDGGTWTPNSGVGGYTINVNGYANWPAADVNGSNVLFKEPNGTWHMYFDDFSSSSPGGVHHATSTDFVNYNYVGKAVTQTLVMQDIKAFTFGGQTYYFSLYHLNGQWVYGTVSSSLNALGSPAQLFNATGADDLYIVSAGLVQDGKKIYGVLYGAGPTPQLASNNIFARWLQKKVIFQNDSVRWGDVERGFGPDSLRLYFSSGISAATGKFYVYDTDGTTLLYISPSMTIHTGDVFQYSGG